MTETWNGAALIATERYFAGKHNKRAGLVTSWDPVRHLAKVMFQPEGHETGWIPVHTMAAGNGFGLMTGLMPGDGKTTGDQVEVEYQEGDFETGAIVSRIHSQVDVPPTVQSGEQLLMSPFGSSAKLAMDGSVTLTDKGGAVIHLDGTGNITHTPASGKTVFLGGNGTTGTYAFVLCVGNIPSINTKARTA